MTTPTDTQLQQALAKMLPEKIVSSNDWRFDWVDNSGQRYYKVIDTEWLYVCWLVEQTLSHEQGESQSKIFEYTELLSDDCHASWQQRTIALCKVKGIEIV